MPKRSAEKERVWRERMVEQRDSGLSVRQYCLRKELSEASFYGWKRELALRDQEVSESAGRIENEQVFVPLHVTASPSSVASLELLHRSGHVIRIPAGFDDQVLRRLLAVLES